MKQAEPRLPHSRGQTEADHRLPTFAATDQGAMVSGFGGPLNLCAEDGMATRAARDLLAKSMGVAKARLVPSRACASS